MIKGRILAALAATISILGVFAIGGTASAQYPPPDGDLFCSVGQLKVNANGTADFTVTLIDEKGNPVPNKTVVFELVQQPGGAYVSPVMDVTDPKGQANTLITTGARPGKIVIEATFDRKKCRAELVNEVLPVVQVFSAPKTGDGGLVSNGLKGSVETYAGIAGGLVIIVLLIGLLVRSKGPVWQGGRRN